MEKEYVQVSKLLFPEKSTLNKTPSQQFEDQLRNQLHSMRQEREKLLNPEAVSIELENENYKEIAGFIKQHVLTVGKEQAILDFQVGLNLLNAYKKESLIESKIQLKEDSVFCEKTYSTLLDVLQNYPIEVLKHYIKLGAANNAIWSTKNNQKIDTDEKVENITLKLNERTN